MKVIYCCFGGSHSSVTAAAIHTGILSAVRIPQKQELLAVPFYEQQTGKDHGYFHFMGHDEWKNEVYVVGKHHLKHHFEEMMRQIVDMLVLNQKEIVIIDTMPYVNWAMMIGGFASRRLGWVKIGRPIVVWGTKRAYDQLVQLVQNIKATVACGSTGDGGAG